MFCKKVFTWSCKWLCSESIFKEGVYLFCCWSFVVVHRLSFRMNLVIYGHTRYYTYSNTWILDFWWKINKNEFKHHSLLSLHCNTFCRQKRFQMHWLQRWYVMFMQRFTHPKLGHVYWNTLYLRFKLVFHTESNFADAIGSVNLWN